MMIRRTTWVILAVFVVLLGFTIYWQRNKPVEVETTPAAELKDIVTFEMNKIQSVALEDTQGRRVQFERAGESDWKLLEPADVEGEQTQMSQAVSRLVSLTSLSEIDSVTDLSILGLAPSSAYTITVGLDDDQTSVIRIGKITATGSGYYVKIDDGPVNVVGKFAIEEITGLLDNPPVAATVEGTQAPAVTAEATEASMAATETSKPEPTQPVTETLVPTPTP